MGGSLLDNETRPGQSSAAQAQDAGLVRTLCVAREGAYATLHEPPTADPHGGWCGGGGLETPGYPIGQLRHNYLTRNFQTGGVAIAFSRSLACIRIAISSGCAIVDGL